MSKARYYIGVMSGTSADGVDLALVTFNQQKAELISHYYQPYDKTLKDKITQLYLPSDNEIDRLGQLDIELAHFFANAINLFIRQEKLTTSDVIAIGCHGQTIRHRPANSEDIAYPFTLQIGCNQTLACLTGIRTIGDFRTKDIALGGQGAPLVPAFHQYLFQKQTQDVVVVNLGGIANITYLPKDKQQTVIGFDTGPANALLDAWCLQHTGQNFDQDGAWGAQGQINQVLLDKLLTDAYFTLPAPKSTGREYFNLHWLARYLADFDISAIDVQATLAALTANSVTNAINELSPKVFVYLCGGGVNNKQCYKQIKQQLKSHRISTIDALELNNNAFEAMAFAWLAFAYDKKIYGNIPTVTGARKQVVLGVEYTS